MISVSQDRSPTVEIVEGKTTELAVGSPILGELTADVSGRTVEFRYCEKDSAGQNVAVVFEGKNEEVPRRGAFVAITDADGKPIDRAALRWQPEFKQGAAGISARAHGAWTLRWQAPARVSGTLSARLDREAGPFEVKVKPVTFTVK